MESGWTHKTPTEPGYYWHLSYTEKVFVVQLKEDDGEIWVHYVGDDGNPIALEDVEEFDPQWSGPLSPPQPPK